MNEEEKRKLEDDWADDVTEGRDEPLSIAEQLPVETTDPIPVVAESATTDVTAIITGLPEDISLAGVPLPTQEEFDAALEKVAQAVTVAGVPLTADAPAVDFDEAFKVVGLTDLPPKDFSEPPPPLTLSEAIRPEDDLPPFMDYERALPPLSEPVVRVVGVSLAAKEFLGTLIFKAKSGGDVTQFDLRKLKEMLG